MIKKGYGITSNTLKVIACISMAIDHLGFVFCKVISLETYNICRAVGRLAFPIFIFLLVEGFFHTSSRLTYLFRLIIFAFISEFPYDLVFSGQFFDPGKQSVIAELTLGFLMLCVCDKIFCCMGFNKALKYVLCFLIAIVFGAGAYFLKTSYDFFGIGMIFLLYLLYPYRKAQILGGILGFLTKGFTNVISVFAILGFIPILMYNGRRGVAKLKYFFYLFYPLHLLILWGLFCLLTD